MDDGGIGGAINLWSLPPVGPIWGVPSNSNNNLVNNNYSSGTQCTSLGLYFLCEAKH